MNSRTPSLGVGAAGLARRSQRREYRHQIQSLTYVNLDHANYGIIRNLGHSGIALQAVAPLGVDQQISLRFDLANPRVHLEATARVAWADHFGQAGVEFLALSQRSQRLLKEWILVQLLTAADHAVSDSTLAYGDADQDAAELLFSPVSRPTIRLQPEVTAGLPRTAEGEDENNARPLQLPWLPISISALALSRLVDGLILLSAVLLFTLICLAMVGDVPAWPVALVFGFGVAAIFTALYRFLFLFWIGGTPGSRLAGLTGAALGGSDREPEERPRFR